MNSVPALQKLSVRTFRTFLRSQQPMFTYDYYRVCHKLIGPFNRSYSCEGKQRTLNPGKIYNKYALGCCRSSRNCYNHNCQHIAITIRNIHLSSVSSASKEDANENVDLSGGDKTMHVKLKSTRIDAVLKAGLGISRNKIEKALYEDRVRLNGERPKKKSQTVDEGDEVDIVRGYNKLNPNFIDVSRVEVLELTESEDPDSDSDEDNNQTKIPAVIKRSKLLTVKNYTPPWKGNTDDD